MGRFVEPKEIYSKIDKARLLLEYVAENGSLLMKPSTIEQYKDIVSVVHDCENLLNAILDAQDVRRMSASQLRSPQKVSSELSSSRKETMRIYRSKFSDLRLKQFSSSDVKSCVDSLYEWFHMRFKSATESSFRYNPEKICNYIDQFIVAYGYYIREKSASEFEDDFYEWSKTVDVVGCTQYPLPKFILDIYEMPQGTVPEAVVLEDEIKNSLYDSNFYPDRLKSIYDMYHNDWPEHSISTIKMRSKI